MRNDDAVSETMAAALIISIAVVGVAIVGLTVLPLTQADEIPAIDFIPGIDTSGENHALYLYHDGGDTLRVGEFKILINGENRTEDFAVAEGGNEWTIGKTLVMTYDEDELPPEIVQLVYTGSGGENLLKTTAINEVIDTAESSTLDMGEEEPPEEDKTGNLRVTSNPTGATIFLNGMDQGKQTDTTITGVPTGDYTITVTKTGYHDASAPVTVTEGATATVHFTLTKIGDDEPEVLHDGVTFFTFSPWSYIKKDGHVQFNVTGNDSYVKIEGTKYNVSAGDTVRLKIGCDGDGRILITDSAITEFQFGRVSLFINDELKRTGRINHILINGYKDFESTLTLKSPKTLLRWYTMLIMDGETIFDERGRHSVNIYNLNKDNTGTMLLYNPGGVIFYSGGASSVEY